ncbi:hypothetical protein ACFP63_16575 [Oerskovia jenensis]|uniref:Uncharacterized protein n=1 Tax=Oerskovia jenensis TaxID=162169 RepID=A0ABS2LF24_9CELL|nr:hypothetical protein [Oerskovia jenensis]MBM7478744.1 hypothetical protein [Oerskovia jenensis]
MKIRLKNGEHTVRTIDAEPDIDRVVYREDDGSIWVLSGTDSDGVATARCFLYD